MGVKVTSIERSSQFMAVSTQLLDYLNKQKSPMNAGSLIRQFCKSTGTDVTTAEVALSLLLNRGDVATDRELALSGRAKQAA